MYDNNTVLACQGYANVLNSKRIFLTVKHKKHPITVCPNNFTDRCLLDCETEIEFESCFVIQLAVSLQRRIRAKVILEDGKSLPVLTCISGRNFDTQHSHH